MDETIKTRSGRTLVLNTPEEEAAIQRGIDEDPDTYLLTSMEIRGMKRFGSVETTPFDPTDYLRTDEERDAFLVEAYACARDDDFDWIVRIHQDYRRALARWYVAPEFPDVQLSEEEEAREDAELAAALEEANGEPSWPIPEAVLDADLAGVPMLRVWRFNQRVPLARVAQAAGLTEAELRAIERGEQEASVEVRERIAAALGLPAWLFSIEID